MNKLNPTEKVLLVSSLFFSLFAVMINVEAQDEPLEVKKNATQIVLGNVGAIDKWTSYGDYNPPDGLYQKYYNPINVFDNVLSIDSSFIQNGFSGFKITTKEEIKDEICRAEVYLHNPNNAQFNVTFGDVTYKGVMNNQLIKFNTLDNGKCIKDIDEISMNFLAPAETWTTVQEMKLFSNEPVDPEPIECDKGWHLENGVCVKDGEPPIINNGTSTFNITNSNATLNFQNSTVILKLDNIIVDIGNETEITDSYSNITKPVSRVTIQGGGN